MDADQLYGLPLDQFIAERGALVKSLRAEGQRGQAAEVAALRKPSVAAWAVNQLVRTQRRGVDELFAAGDALRDVQAEVMAGRQDAQALRDAAGDERAAVEALIASAHGLLTSEGHELSQAVIDRVADTLHAAALDDDARAEVDEGRLERELRHAGLGAGGLSAPTRAERSAGKQQTATANPRDGGQRDEHVAKRQVDAKRTIGERSADAKRTVGERPADAKRTVGERPADAKRTVSERRADAKRIERERADARRIARSAEADARREADRAARALKIAQERRERAAQALADADEELANATSQAQAAVEAHGRARDELDSS
jgi:hypothetical protein